MRVFAWVLAVILVMLGLVWIVPPALNWNAHKGLIARFASAELDRTVQIDGKVALSLLPRPVLSARSVRISGRQDGVRVVAPALRMELAPWPLLLGRIVPRNLVLRNVRIDLPWPLPPAVLALHEAAAAGVLSARLENATLRVGRLTLTQLDANLTANAVTPGEMSVTGTARLLAQQLGFGVRLDPADATGNAPLDLRLAALPVTGTAKPVEDFGLRWQGVWQPDGRLAGRVTAHAAALAATALKPLLPATLDGTLTLAGDRATGSLQVNSGGAGATVALASASDGSQAVAISAPVLDARPVLRLLRPARPGAGWRVPALGLDLDLSLDTSLLRLPGVALATVRAAAQVSAAGTAAVSAFSAVLPGQAALTLAGTVARDPMLTFAGQFHLDAPDLHQTLAWLAADGVGIAAPFPSGALRAATLSGSVRVTKLALHLDGLNGTVDGAAVSGAIGVDPASGAVEATLALPQLAADNWLPQSGLPGWTEISQALSGLDLALKLKADRVTLRGRTLTGVTLDAATAKGGLSVNAFSALLNGMTLGAAGTVAADGTVSGVTADLGMDHAAALAAVLPGLPAFTPAFWQTPLHVHIEATGPRAAVLAGLGVAFGDARLQAHPTLDLVKGTWSTQMTLRHPGAARLLQALGWTRAPDWLGDGSLSALAQLSGTAGTIEVQTYDLTAASLHATGAMNVVLPAKAVPQLSGTVAADTLPLPGFAARATAPWPLGWTRALTGALSVTAQQVTLGGAPWLHGVTGTIALSQGTLGISVAKATLARGTLSGQVSLDPTTTPAKLNLTARLDGVTLEGPLFGTPLDLARGRVTAGLDLTALGSSPATWLASLAGTLDASLADGAWGGVDLSAAPSETLGAGATPFSTLTARTTLANGVMTLQDVTMTTPAGPVQLTGMLDFPDSRLSVLATMADGHAARLLGPFAAPARH